MSRAIEQVHHVDLYQSLDNLKSQLASITFYRNTGVVSGKELCPERICYRVACCRLDKWVSSSLIGGG